MGSLGGFLPLVASVCWISNGWLIWGLSLKVTYDHVTEAWSQKRTTAAAHSTRRRRDGHWTAVDGGGARSIRHPPQAVCPYASFCLPSFRPLPDLQPLPLAPVLRWRAVVRPAPLGPELPDARHTLRPLRRLTPGGVSALRSPDGQPGWRRCSSPEVVAACRRLWLKRAQASAECCFSSRHHWQMDPGLQLGSSSEDRRLKSGGC
jgi:hypothetical protein